jgi:hypothetical protein
MNPALPDDAADAPTIAVIAVLSARSLIMTYESAALIFAVPVAEMQRTLHVTAVVVVIIAYDCGISDKAVVLVSGTMSDFTAVGSGVFVESTQVKLRMPAVVFENDVQYVMADNSYVRPAGSVNTPVAELYATVVPICWAVVA